ncbi:hypothetical protein [Streptomyces abikoensis]
MTPFLADLLIDASCRAQHCLDGAGARLPYPAPTPTLDADEAQQEEHRARCRQKALELLECAEELVHLLSTTPRRSAATRAVAAHPPAGRHAHHAVECSQGDTGILQACREVFAAHVDRQTLPTAVEFTAVLRRHRPDLPVGPALHDGHAA